MRFSAMWRLEADPQQRDPARGWSAELADPAWMLGRQWQLGEHQGEDASSPVAVTITASSSPIEAVPAQPHLDPTTVPAEAIIESEPGDWWTPGRRIRIGRRVANQAGSLPLDVALAGLPAPYQALDGSGPDGRLLWLQRSALGLADSAFGPVRPPDEPADLWDPAMLSYTAELPAAGTTLRLDRHDGGHLDWFHADAAGPIDTTAAGTTTTTTTTTPGRVRYPSAPLPRWWQIEDAAVSIGGEPPDPASLATVVLIDLIVNHSDDWFSFATPVTAGSVTTFVNVTVTDTFGDTWELTPPTDWSLFTTSGLDGRSLVVWATARTPLEGPVLDEVTIGIDEDSNLVWAVEHVVAGRTVSSAVPPRPVATGSGRYTYSPMTPVPPHWHPYVVDEVDGRRVFVQGRAADYSGPVPTLMPEPLSDLLRDPSPGGTRPVHHFEPAAISSNGVRVQRRAMLARATTGEPVLWTQRQRLPLLVLPALALRFDELRQE
jgi:hypothetical protein